MLNDRHLLLLCGSLRAGSSNEAVLRTAELLAPDGLTVTRYQGLGALPHFNPDADRDPLPAEVAALREAVGSADAVLVCTPEYAGTLPGSFKNLLDWMIGGTQLTDKPVGFVNAAGPGRGEGSHATLRTVLGYAGAVLVEPACVRIPIPRDAYGEDGVITDPALRTRITEVLAALAG